VIVALAGPVLGAIADASGKRKAWIAVFSLGAVVGLCGLWLAVPGETGRVPVVAAALILAVVSVEFATVFTNAMMPGLVPAHRLGRLSGTGWAVGYAGGLVSLLVAAGGLIADPETGTTMLGFKSVLPLDAFAYEGERAVGPFSALWYALFVLPLFFFTPDRAPARPRAGGALKAGFRQLFQTLAQARRYAGILRFLVARMLYVDGLGAIFAFGGLYAGSVFGWDSARLGLFGMLLTFTGAFGAFAGGWLDDRFGPRAVILASLAGLMIASLGIVSIEETRVLFVLAVAPPEPGDAPFSSIGEQFYLAFAAVIGLLAGPVQAASRSYLAHLAPPAMMTEFFGLYAFSGKITAFAAPLLVGLVTTLTGSQRWGVAVILLFLAGGFAILAGAKDARE
jgi:UMF1 family MFS transporter